MKVFIFKEIEQVSDRFHSGGGLVIIAKNIEHAKQLISDDEDIKPTDDEWLKVESYDLVGDVEPKYWVMPDAGCC